MLVKIYWLSRDIVKKQTNKKNSRESRGNDFRSWLSVTIRARTINGNVIKSSFSYLVQIAVILTIPRLVNDAMSVKNLKFTTIFSNKNLFPRTAVNPRQVLRSVVRRNERLFKNIYLSLKLYKYWRHLKYKRSIDTVHMQITFFINAIL